MKHPVKIVYRELLCNKVLPYFDRFIPRWYKFNLAEVEPGHCDISMIFCEKNLTADRKKAKTPS